MKSFFLFVTIFLPFFFIDIHFIGRRVKVQKVIEQGKAKLHPKSKKRKANDLTSDVIPDCNEIEKSVLKNEILDLKSNDLNSMNIELINNGDKISINVHLLSDLRGVTNIDEKKTIYYGAICFCDGGDLLFRNFNKNQNILKRKFLLSSSNDNKNGILNNKSTFPTAQSSNSTTTMDFDRCYLTVSSARVIPGAVVIDPFAGSGNILHMASVFGAALTLSSDIDPLTCSDSNTFMVRVIMYMYV
jgi:hypothetical protein